MSHYEIMAQSNDFRSLFSNLGTSQNTALQTTQHESGFNSGGESSLGSGSKRSFDDYQHHLGSQNKEGISTVHTEFIDRASRRRNAERTFSSAAEREQYEWSQTERDIMQLHLPFVYILDVFLPLFILNSGVTFVML